MTLFRRRKQSAGDEVEMSLVRDKWSTFLVLPHRSVAGSTTLLGSVARTGDKLEALR